MIYRLQRISEITNTLQIQCVRHVQHKFKKKTAYHNCETSYSVLLHAWTKYTYWQVCISQRDLRTTYCES